MTQQQLGEELRRLREENPEDKAAGGKLIKEFLDQRREFLETRQMQGIPLC